MPILRSAVPSLLLIADRPTAKASLPRDRTRADPEIAAGAFFSDISINANLTPKQLAKLLDTLSSRLAMSAPTECAAAKALCTGELYGSCGNRIRWAFGGAASRHPAEHRTRPDDLMRWWIFRSHESSPGRQPLSSPLFGYHCKFAAWRLPKGNPGGDCLLCNKGVTIQLARARCPLTAVGKDAKVPAS
jgi:hypothetical protein